jgi:hypothetical protein
LSPKWRCSLAASRRNSSALARDHRAARARQAGERAQLADQRRRAQAVGVVGRPHQRDLAADQQVQLGGRLAGLEHRAVGLDAGRLEQRGDAGQLVVGEAPEQRDQSQVIGPRRHGAAL